MKNVNTHVANEKSVLILIHCLEGKECILRRSGMWHTRLPVLLAVESKQTKNDSDKQFHMKLPLRFGIITRDILQGWWVRYKMRLNRVMFLVKSLAWALNSSSLLGSAKNIALSKDMSCYHWFFKKTKVQCILSSWYSTFTNQKVSGSVEHLKTFVSSDLYFPFLPHPFLFNTLVFGNVHQTLS